MGHPFFWGWLERTTATATAKATATADPYGMTNKKGNSDRKDNNKRLW
jgi:hypothetical protein